ncbi:MAG: NERD domain-containing protein [Burkholderiales bacterium]|nr:NERD domain-containing protein [Burkholderiales bacterium]
MAQFPQGYTHIDARCNSGERRVLQQLRRCLEDDYIVWHNVPIGPRARQPDFVVLSPRWGVLLLEVKDWKRATLVGASPDAVELATPRGRITEANPLRQARDVTLELVDLMQRDAALVRSDGPFRGKLLFPYGWGVVFSGLRRHDLDGSDFHDVFGEHRVLLRDDLDDSTDAAAFQQRLWGMFTVHYPHTLTLPQRDRVRWHLFPEIRLQPTQGQLDLDGDTLAPAAATPIVLPDLLQVMDLQQEQIARGLGEGHRVIHGAAGSGKTMILIYRAQQLAAAARADRPILVLCYNRALSDRIEAQLRQRGVDERVQVRTFHGWCQDLVRSYQLDLPTNASGDAYFEALARTVDRAVESGRVPGGQYAALLVDEAHDFEDAWLRLAARMVDPATNSLLVLYDDAQSIYQKKRRKFNFASVGIEARGRTSVLRMNYRNTAEVLALAVHCAHSLLDGGARVPHMSLSSLPADESAGDDLMRLVQPASAGRRGPLPVLISARTGHDEAELIAERITTALNGGLPAGEIAVLCRAKYLLRPLEQVLRQRGIDFESMNSSSFRRFDWRVQRVRLLTLHSAKGLEFSLCCIAGLQALPMHGETIDDALRLLYVGMTRATHELVLSAQGSTSIVDQVRQALAEVGRQLA